MKRRLKNFSLCIMLAFSLVLTGASPAQQAQSPAPAKGASPAFTPQQLDELTAPIALYPDALLAQMLTCSQNYFQLRELSDFLKKNSKLKGSAVQDAAQKEGFETSYVALSTFPDVVQMMAEKADWTKKLGQAFTTNQQGVFDSIQRLRAQAQKQGNLKTTEQQEVVTQKTQSGTQVIVIQPANPQVVYVPQYNPQVVYVQPAPPPQPSASGQVAAALIGFTAGVIIGAAADDHYYWGPHGWRGGYMYHDAWEDYYHFREDAREDWYDHRENMSDNRQKNVDERQGNREQNVDERQGNREQNVDERQGNREQNVDSRQANQDTRQASRQEASGTRQSTRQSAQATNQTAGQAGASQGRTGSYGTRGHGAQTTQASQQQTGTRSGAFSGYGSASRERSAEARGTSSLKSSRSSRKGGRSRD